MYTRMEEFSQKVEDLVSSIQEDFSDYQDKHFPVRSPEFFCLELNGEAGELANAEKKIWKGKEVAGELIEDEAADVFIALMNYSNARGINLGEAIKHKLHKIENKRIALLQKGQSF